MDGFQCLVEGAHVTHVSIALCPLSKTCPSIILNGPKLSLKCTAGRLVYSVGSLIIRFCKHTIVAGTFLLKQLLDFPICCIKPALVLPSLEAKNLSRGFLRMVPVCFNRS